jgi:hypothetical protein
MVGHLPVAMGVVGITSDHTKVWEGLRGGGGSGGMVMVVLILALGAHLTSSKMPPGTNLSLLIHSG